MPIYLWKGRNRQGEVKKGEIDAADAAGVAMQLRAQSLIPVSVKSKPKDVSEYLPFLQERIKTRDLVVFTRQFATMIDAGLPLVQCLDILSTQSTNSTMKRVLREVKSDVEQGSTFADALKKHPRPFRRKNHLSPRKRPFQKRKLDQRTRSHWILLLLKEMKTMKSFLLREVVQSLPNGSR